MATRLSESRVDHCGQPPPKGIYAPVNPGGEVASYKDRSREADDDSVARRRLEWFSPRKLGSLDRARGAAINHGESALEIVRADDAVLYSEKAARRTVGKLFNEWIALHAAHSTGKRSGRDSVRTWDNHIEPRLGRVRRGALAVYPGTVVPYDEELRRAGLAISAPRALLALLGWGRHRCSRTLNVDVAGLFRVPTYKCRASAPSTWRRSRS